MREAIEVTPEAADCSVNDRHRFKDAIVVIDEIFLMEADGDGVKQLTQLGFRSTGPAFSPDGRTILFTRSGGGFADLFSIPLAATH